MYIKGWIKSTLLDYPGRIAAAFFCGGCNFRCPNCHNRDLVLALNDLPDIRQEEIWAFLQKRRVLLDGVVISGGEPTLQPDLLDFAVRLHEMGFLVKLDTNGYRPDVIQEMLAVRAVDFVAMDIKAPPDRYGEAAGVQVDVGRIRRSVDLLLGGEVAYEFRTTVVPGLLEKEDVLGIARWISGAERYCLQQFVPQNTLDPAMMDRSPYLPAALGEMADLVKPYVGQVEVRGI